MPSYTLDKPDNLLDLFEESVSAYTDRPLVGTKNRGTGAYEWVTFREVGRRVDALRAGFARLGVGPGDAVGIIANNRTEWIVAAFATYGLGARFVPMYESELPSFWKYAIADSAMKVLLVSTSAILATVRAFAPEIPTLQHIIGIEDDTEDGMAALERQGALTPVAARRAHPDEIAVLIYTSGTTGEPKGVLLSHGNVASNTLAGIQKYPELLVNEVRTLVILPWAHVYGQTGELYALIRLGGALALAESPATIAADMALARPTWLMAVPRVFNRIYDALQTKMAQTGGLAKAMFDMGVASAKCRRELAGQGKTCWWVNLKFRLADRIVFRKIRARFGGRLMGAMSGSAVMNADIARFFFDIGIPIYDCYGMTETAPAVAMNASFAYRWGSVGKALDKVSIVIDASVVEPGATDGEIVVYGPNVMQGYHNKPEETRKVMTADGGLRTGDRGRLDEDGFLYITGRIKEQFKLENGKYIFPSALEEDICLSHWVQQAVVCGENRPYTVCIVVPDFEALQRHGERHRLEGDSADLVADPEIREMISADIVKALTGKYGSYEIPKRFLFRREPFSLANGMLTQTMKLKRRIILEQLRDEIDALYREP